MQRSTVKNHARVTAARSLIQTLISAVAPSDAYRGNALPGALSYLATDAANAAAAG
jgi:hypothetical protein